MLALLRSKALLQVYNLKMKAYDKPIVSKHYPF